MTLDRENVLPYLGDYRKWDNEEELLESVWQFWMKWKEEVYVIPTQGFLTWGYLCEKLNELEKETKLVTFDIKPQYPFLKAVSGRGFFDTPAASLLSLRGGIPRGELPLPVTGQDLSVSVRKGCGVEHQTSPWACPAQLQTDLPL